MPANHSYEEIRQATLDVLSERERCSDHPTQYGALQRCVAFVFFRREAPRRGNNILGSNDFESYLTPADANLFLEVFWDLFRQGIITLGYNDSNREFPFFRVSSYGQRLLQQNDAYFFHDVSSYEAAIRANVPTLDSLTMLYLKEAMQAFRASCLLASTVMLGVATEHAFQKLLDTIEDNPDHAPRYANAFAERALLRKFNKFRNILEGQMRELPSELKEDLDTNLSGILSIIRNFRNESGHPTGRVISREQCYVLLNLFIPYAKKIEELSAHFAAGRPAA